MGACGAWCADRAGERARREGNASGGEAFSGPGGALFEVAEAVVEAAGAAVPELDFLGGDAVAAPGFGHGDGVAFRVLPGEAGHVRFQLFAGGGAALW